MSDDQRRTEIRKKVGSIKKGGWTRIGGDDIFRTFGGDEYIFRGPEGGTKGSLDDVVEILADKEDK